MVDYLNDDINYMGDVTAHGELAANGGFVIGAGGSHYGEPPSESTPGLTTWPVVERVRVFNKGQRDNLVAWRNANAPITSVNPLLVWRADGSSTGLSEMTVDGTNWVAESPKAGDIVMTIAGDAPHGWIMLNGGTIVNCRTLYPALWAEASSNLRVGANDLRIPDMRGRVPMGSGKGSSLTLRVIGEQLGEEEIYLATQQLPKHSHTGKTGNPDRSLNHRHFTKFNHVMGQNIAGEWFRYERHDPDGEEHMSSTVTAPSAPNAGSTLIHQHSFTTNSTGEGWPIDILQPSTVVHYRMKL